MRLHRHCLHLEFKLAKRLSGPETQISVVRGKCCCPVRPASRTSRKARLAGIRARLRDILDGSASPQALPTVISHSGTKLQTYGLWGPFLELTWTIRFWKMVVFRNSPIVQLYDWKVGTLGGAPCSPQIKRHHTTKAIVTHASASHPAPNNYLIVKLPLVQQKSESQAMPRNCVLGLWAYITRQPVRPHAAFRSHLQLPAVYMRHIPLAPGASKSKHIYHS